MQPTTLHLSSRFAIGAISPLIYGGFLEHMGRAVYEGVFEPGGPTADTHGFRTDVLDALAELEMTVVRYPGGNFVSGYHWRDGVGPVEQRPRKRDLAWQSLEPNTFGTDEFLKLCDKLDWQPMLAVNLGTGTPEEARDWVEYCNGAAGTELTDLREGNGHAAPYDVPLWCLGNEMDGPWQLGHVPAEQYAIRAQQAAMMMKNVDRDIRTVVCGSSGPQMQTFAEWDAEVLERVGSLADYVSLHRYVGNPEDNLADYLATSASIDRQIEQVDAVCRYVQAKRRSKTRAYLCFDEWNVWYKARTPADMDGAGQFAPHLIEEVYNLEDTLVTAGFLMSFLRHADVVKVANIAQIVNVIAPIMTRGEELLKQAPFYAFRMFSTRPGGLSLTNSVDGPTFETSRGERLPWLDSAASWDAEQGVLHLFLTNRHPDEPMALTVHHDLPVGTLASGEVLTGDDPKLANTFEAPDVLVAEAFDEVTIGAGEVRVQLPPLSLTALTLSSPDA